MRLYGSQSVLFAIALGFGMFTACKDGETDTGTDTDTNVTADEDCGDDEDNDGDGDVDCDDSDCEGDRDCPTEEDDCDDGDDNDNDGDVDCDDADCEGDNDCEPEYITPYAFFVGGMFGYDADTDTIVTVIASDGTPIPPYIEILIMEEEYFGAGDDRYMCTIWLTYGGGTEFAATVWDFTDVFADENGNGTPGEAGDEFTARHVGVTLPSFTVDTDCLEEDGKGIDPDWGTIDDITGNDFGTGIGNWRTDLGDYVQDPANGFDDTSTSIDETDYYFGGGMYWGLLEDAGYDGYAAPNIAYGWATDADGNVLQDADGNDQLLYRADVLTSMTNNGEPPTGVYRVAQFYGWLADYLLQ